MASLVERARSLRRQAASLTDIAVLLHRMAGPHRGLMYLASGFSVGLGLVEGMVMMVAVPLLSRMLGEGQPLPPILRWVAELFKAGNSEQALVTGIVWVAAGLILKQVLAGLIRLVSYLASARIVTHVRGVIMRNLLEARFAFLDGMKSGSARQLIVAETSKLVSSSRAVADLVGSVFSTLVMVSLLISISPALTGIALLMALLALPFKFFYSVRLYRASEANVSATMAMMNHLNEALMGIRQIKLQNRQQAFEDQMRAASAESELQFRRVSMFDTWEPVLVQVYVLAGILLVIGLGQDLGIAPLSQVVGYFLVLYRSLPIVHNVNSALNALLAARPSLLLVAQYFFMKDDVREPRGGLELPRPEVGRIAVEDVHFGYGDGPAVLSGVSLEARRGQMVAIAGPSGCGKSSVMHLLLGMYPPRAGRILVDGIDTTELSVAALRDAVGLVSQDVHLFNTTVFEVIRGGRAQLAAEAVEAAAREAEAHDFILALPKGYQTRVGERGVRLSGGQRQRLLLAQIYARRTPVILLDEATSALDRLTEKQIFEHLKSRRAGRIVVIVTHRLANLEDADWIYYLEHGRIVESGGWAELNAARGRFWEMCQRHVDEPPAPEPEAEA